MRMDGRTVVVTGAARGIGRAVAERLAQAGAVTLCADLDFDVLGEVVDGIARCGRDGRGAPLRCL